MRTLFRPVSHRYRTFLHRWENQLCFRANDRVVRPFEFGLEWSDRWPSIGGVSGSVLDPIEYLERVNREVIRQSAKFYGYDSPSDFRLSGEWLQFTSPVESPYRDNNTVHARWFPSRGSSRKAVVLLPHWNSKQPQHNALCAGLQRLGLSTLRLSLPYHDARMPPELARADFAVSSNICRTIDATRQAIIDSRACFDWLEQQGFEDFAIVGTSLGSCYAFLASAHDSRIRVNVFNHCSTYFADVVWEGLSTRHIRDSFEGAIDLPVLRKLWACISPPNYWDLYSTQQKRSKFIYTQFDTTFPVHLSRQVIESARQRKWDHEVKVLPCGHYTMGEFPFKYLTGYEICSFLKRNL
jgi:hypothetical protein